MITQKIAGLLAALVVLAFAGAVTKPQHFTTGYDYCTLGDTFVAACSTQIVPWGESPTASFAWNASGDSGAQYIVAIKSSDLYYHFPFETDTLDTFQITAADSTRAHARRVLLGFDRNVSTCGQLLFIDLAANDTTAVVIDSVNFVPDVEGR
jgi:hypothetical protein